MPKSSKAIARRGKQPRRKAPPRQKPTRQVVVYRPTSRTKPVSSAMTYARAVNPRMRTGGAVGSYMRAVVNPWDTLHAERYPDETITPTVTTKMAAEFIYDGTVSGNNGNWGTLLGWKMFSAAAAHTSVNWWPVIGAPQNMATFSANSDYGAPEASWEPLSAADRTLACGIRVRLQGLGPSVFMAPGVLYFIQYQSSDFTQVLGAINPTPNEAFFQQMVAAGRGFSVTCAELASVGSVGIPFFPQGPNSFVYSGTNAVHAAGTDTNATSTSDSVNANVLPNGGVFVAGFGCGTSVFRVNYAHHLEYINTVSSSGIVAPQQALADAGIREGIARTSSSIQQKIAGSTSVGPIANLLTDLASAAGAAFGGAAASAAGPIGSSIGAAAGSYLAEHAMLSITGGGARSARGYGGGVPLLRDNTQFEFLN